MITKEQIKLDLIKVKDLIGKIPTKKEYKQNSSYGVNTVSRRFGSWNNALIEIFGEINNRSKANYIKIKCDVCNKEFERKDIEIKDKNFCSISCSNRGKPKRKYSKHCEKCNNLIPKVDRFCKQCRIEYLKENSIENRTLGSFKHIYGPVRYSQIREHARSEAVILDDVCVNCGYDKHVEVCHKKDIPSFTDDTLIKEINALYNLVKLCKNCHWESHNGYLDINKF